MLTVFLTNSNKSFNSRAPSYLTGLALSLPLKKNKVGKPLTATLSMSISLAVESILAMTCRCKGWGVGG